MVDLNHECFEAIADLPAEVTPLTSIEAQVGFGLCRFADKGGLCYPGVAEICRVTRLKRSAVLEGLRGLEEKKIIQVAHFTAGRGVKRDSNTYRFTLYDFDYTAKHTSSPDRLVRFTALTSVPHGLEVNKEVYIGDDERNGRRKKRIGVGKA